MWRTWHVVYYEPDKDGLLLDGIYPVLQQLVAEGVARHYYCQRHWRQGPRVIVNLDVAEDRYEQAAVRFVAAVTAYLEQRPSRVQIDRASLLAQHRRLASLELDTGPLEPLDDDNSFQERPYLPPLTASGDGAVEVAADFFIAAAPLLFDMMSESRGSHEVRLAQVLQYLMLTQLVLGDPRFSQLSPRSHAEAFLHRYDRDGTLRHRLEEQFARKRTALVTSFAEMRAYADGEGASSRLQTWTRLIRRTSALALAAVEAGAIALPDREFYLPRAQSMGATQYDGPPSAFHSRLLSSEFFQRVAQTSQFKMVRYLTNIEYSALALAGITPLERFRLLYLLSLTFEAATGTSWTFAIEHPEAMPRLGEIDKVLGG